MKASFTVIGVILALTCACGLAACSSVGESATVATITVPATVKPPAFINAEIASYGPQFYAILAKHGFTVGKTDDPGALQLEINFDPNPLSTTIEINLVQSGGGVVVSARATNPGFGTVIAREVAIGNLAQSASAQFDARLSRVKFNIRSDRGGLQTCINALATNPDLQPLRSKVELGSELSDTPPPFEIASDESYATNAERLLIAKWAGLRDGCVRDIFANLPRSESTLDETVAQQDMAFGKEAIGRVSELIVALYQGKLTYGEFAQKRYEIGRDAMAAERAFRAASMEADMQRQAQARQLAQQQFQSALLAWSAYIQAVNARQSHTCVSSAVGTALATTCQ